MKTTGGLTKKQVEVIQNQLQPALDACAEAGICFIGMDDRLLAYDRVKLHKAGYLEDPHGSQMALGQGYDVDDSSCYLDSGAW